MPSEPVDNPRNQQWMRLFTTMSLTHSDGFVRLFSGIATLTHHTHFYELEYWIEKAHSEVHEQGLLHSHPEHYWYAFYDVPIGCPVGEIGQTYEGINGLFIREFTNGWVVYNRSGKEQQVQLPMQTTGVASRISSTSHVVHDLDGEIFVK